MKTDVYTPRLDGLFWWITVPTALIMLGTTIGLAISYPPSMFFMIPMCLLVAYFFVSPLFGYVELRDDCVFVRFGFFTKREIPYSSIRGVQKERKFYADSIISLKNAMEHVNIKYNRFDMTTVSVKNNDGLILEIERRIALK